MPLPDLDLVPVRVVTLAAWRSAVQKALTALIARGSRVPDPALQGLYEMMDELEWMLKEDADE